MVNFLGLLNYIIWDFRQSSAPSYLCVSLPFRFSYCVPSSVARITYYAIIRWISFWRSICNFHATALSQDINETFIWFGSLPKVILYPKYSKHWLSTVAHTIDCVCSKILNHGLLFSLFKLFLGWKNILN